MVWYLSENYLSEEAGGAAFAPLDDLDLPDLIDDGDLKWLTLVFSSGDFIEMLYRSVLFGDTSMVGDLYRPAEG